MNETLNFDYNAVLLPEDIEKAVLVLSGGIHDLYPPTRRMHALAWLAAPDALVAHDGLPIMYRWHVVPRNEISGVYLHIQVRSDSLVRGPHDHEYDSFATILAGEYIDQEWARNEQPHPHPLEPVRQNGYYPGHVVSRRAAQLHRIILPAHVPYSMTLFSHGPRIRKWGFANPDGSWSAAEARGPVVNGCVVAGGRAAT